MTEPCGKDRGMKPGELIAAYERSEQSRALARRCVSLIMFGVVLVSIGLIWAEILDFRYRRLPEFASALGNEAADMSPRVTKDVKDMVNRLYPKYVTSFQQMFERDLPMMEQEMTNQLAQLDAYAQARWPLIETGVVDIAVSTEDMVRDEFSTIITPEEAEKIAHAYGKALTGKYDEMLAGRYRKHVELSRDIGETLEGLMTTEPDMRDVQIQDAMGIMLELAGIEMQKGL